MALDEPQKDDLCTRVAKVPFVISAEGEKMIGGQRDVRVEYLRATEEFYVATTLSAGCLAWFESEE